MSKTIDKNNIITSIRSDLGLNEESTLDEDDNDAEDEEGEVDDE